MNRKESGNKVKNFHQLKLALLKKKYLIKIKKLQTDMILIHKCIIILSYNKKIIKGEKVKDNSKDLNKHLNLSFSLNPKLNIMMRKFVTLLK